ncbi:MAG: outer membrane protein assembly factor BamD, partial [Candidatus Auribacterota bacterium]|nr:outer membrane protein assembly factor BamD [Candidatus Auribacterota bacterium]
MNKDMRKFIRIAVFVLAVFMPTLAPAPWIWTPESGKFVNPKWEPKKTAKLQMEHARSLENKREYEKAAYEYKKVAKFFPASAFAPEGQMSLGRVYEKRGQYYEAYLAYKSILEKYPSYGQVNEILDKIYRIGNDFLSGGKRYLWKFKVLSAVDKAAEIFEFIVEQAPYSELAPDAQFKAGLAYQKVRNYNKAVEALEKVIENYPKSDFSDNAKFQIAFTWYTKSKGPQYDQEATDNAIKEFLQFKRGYPESEKKEEAVKLLAELEDRKAEELFMNGV